MAMQTMMMNTTRLNSYKFLSKGHCLQHIIYTPRDPSSSFTCTERNWKNGAVEIWPHVQVPNKLQVTKQLPENITLLCTRKLRCRVITYKQLVLTFQAQFRCNKHKAVHKWYEIL
jgi:hypothetical protein